MWAYRLENRRAATSIYSHVAKLPGVPARAIILTTIFAINAKMVVDYYPLPEASDWSIYLGRQRQAPRAICVWEGNSS
jgi:hypothetical protein